MTENMPHGDVSMHLDDGDVLALVQSESRRLDRRIRHRDARELVAAAIGAILIAPGMFVGSAVARVGAVVMIGGLAFIALRLTRARKAGGAPADFSLAVAESLRAELRRVDTQIALLESVLWWYVAPVTVGALMMVAGRRGASFFTAGYGVFLLLVAWGIVALNTRAARRTLYPRRAELNALLAQIDDSSASYTSVQSKPRDLQ